MATIKVKAQDPRNSLGSTPWGNWSALLYKLRTNAIGAVIGSDSAAAVAIGDKVVLGVLPAGFRFIDSQVVVVTGGTASLAGKLGYEYADGVDDPEAPADDDYFGTGLNLANAARLRNTTGNRAVVLQKDGLLTLVTSGAANAKEAEIEVYVIGIAEGVM